jgi:metal-sulfur cluster biosynthetic enzyme
LFQTLHLVVAIFIHKLGEPRCVSDSWRFIDLIAPISDPEHPLSLESLGVVKLQDVHLISPPDLTNPAALSRVLVELTPTVSHCSLATVIGLGVRVRLEQALPPSYRVEVKIKKDTHGQAEEVNKQLADKERVAAALENANLMNILRNMMKPCLEWYPGSSCVYIRLDSLIVNDISARLLSPRLDFDCLPERADYEMLNCYVPDITPYPW